MPKIFSLDCKIPLRWVSFTKQPKNICLVKIIQKIQNYFKAVKRSSQQIQKVKMFSNRWNFSPVSKYETTKWTVHWKKLDLLIFLHWNQHLHKIDFAQFLTSVKIYGRPSSQGLLFTFTLLYILWDFYSAPTMWIEKQKG